MPTIEEKPREPEIMVGGLKKEVWEIAKILLISFVIVIPIRYFVVQPFIVRGASMEPNFDDREYLIIDELSYYMRGPERGETIVFRFPRDPRQYFIKRIIGLPGERVKISDGVVIIYSPEKADGFLLDEAYLSPENKITRPDIDVQLGKDEYFVLGDNRIASSDSRVWGPLERDLITGRVLIRAWPLSRFGTIEQYSLVPAS